METSSLNEYQSRFSWENHLQKVDFPAILDTAPRVQRTRAALSSSPGAMTPRSRKVGRGWRICGARASSGIPGAMKLLEL